MESKKLHLFLKSLVFIIAISVQFSCSEEKNLPENAVIKFEKDVHDFGNLPLKKNAEISFRFTNDSKNPLKILDVKSSCGCAASAWTKEIIKSSEKGEIKVTYDSEYPGYFNKTITVYYNGKNSPYQLKIRGKVDYPDETNI